MMEITFTTAGMILLVGAVGYVANTLLAANVDSWPSDGPGIGLLLLAIYVGIILIALRDAKRRLLGK